MNPTIGILISGLLICFVFFVIYREWSSEWSGKLVDKKEVYESDSEGYKQKKRKLIFELDEGSKKEISVNKRTYKTAVLGDKYSKTKFSFKPKKI